ncbi:hypothetical protein BS50DRAFT_369010 [Corynespora cassiicola Philippines]|uniref:Uncharacterized protein n=1 Tax=Corynespora cassiicola Philippines TaxID=1448308 RepID=A0A2T2NMB1_CORCC|nr:hypothetical protein BS50DRAFT_369010 [Corynespora cassiicola Philippines]
MADSPVRGIVAVPTVFCVLDILAKRVQGWSLGNALRDKSRPYIFRAAQALAPSHQRRAWHRLTNSPQPLSLIERAVGPIVKIAIHRSDASKFTRSPALASSRGSAPPILAHRHRHISHAQTTARQKNNQKN